MAFLVELQPIGVEVATETVCEAELVLPMVRVAHQMEFVPQVGACACACVAAPKTAASRNSKAAPGRRAPRRPS